jgi:hypothetical protein
MKLRVLFIHRAPREMALILHEHGSRGPFQEYAEAGTNPRCWHSEPGQEYPDVPTAVRESVPADSLAHIA